MRATSTMRLGRAQLQYLYYIFFFPSHEYERPYAPIIGRGAADSAMALATLWGVTGPTLVFGSRALPQTSLCVGSAAKSQPDGEQERTSTHRRKKTGRLVHTHGPRIENIAWQYLFFHPIFSIFYFFFHFFFFFHGHAILECREFIKVPERIARYSACIANIIISIGILCFVLF